MHLRYLTSSSVLKANQTLGTVPKTSSGVENATKCRVMISRPKSHNIRGSHSSTAADSGLLGCDAVLLGKYFPMFTEGHSASDTWGTTYRHNATPQKTYNF
jgi:hypothetical protein